MSRPLAQFAGEGKVLDGTALLAEVRYMVSVYQPYVQTVTTSGRGQAPGLPRVELVLYASKPLQATLNRAPLTLVMQDGRKLHFYVVGDGVYSVISGIVEA